MFFLEESFSQIKTKRISALLFGCLALTACGGGSGDSNDASKGSEKKANNIPTVVVTGDTQILEQTQFKLVGNAQDDGDISKYQWKHNSDLEIDITDYNNSELKAFGADISVPHNVTFTLTVTDDNGATASAEHLVTFLPIPTITIQGETKLEESEAFTLVGKIEEPAVNIRSYQWTHDSSLELTVTGASTPSINVEGIDIGEAQKITFTLIVTDDYDNQFKQSHTVHIEPTINLPPSVSIEGPSFSADQSELKLVATAIDPEGQKVDFAWAHDSNLALNMQANEGGTLIVSIPEIEIQSKVTFTVTATDEFGVSASNTHSLSIIPRPNDIPSVLIQGPKTVEEGLEIKLEGQATDSDGFIASYQWAIDDRLNAPVLDLQSKNLTIQTTDIQEDLDVIFTLEVMDNEGATSTAHHSVIITAKENVTPTVNVEGPASITEQTLFTLSATASDEDGQIVSYQWTYESPVPISVSDTSQTELQVSGVSIDEDTEIKFFVTVTDNQGASVTEQHNITILALPNVPPEVNIVASNALLEERSSFTLNAHAVDSDGQIETYLWQHNSGLDLKLSGENGALLQVEVPDIREDQEITFSVTVTDHQGGKTSESFTATIAHLRATATIKGKVTDAPIAHARVQLHIGSHVYNAVADESGAYVINVNVDESEKDNLVRLSAQGVGAQTNVALVSQLGELSSIVEVAGEEGEVDANEYFGINITNVTTADFALLKESGLNYSNEAQLKEARAHVDADEKLEIAALLKAVIDHNQALPDGVNSTLELVENLREARKMLKALKKSDPELVAKLRAEIKADKDLMNKATEPLLGTYYVSERTLLNGFAAALSFSEDRTGVLKSTHSIPFNWRHNGTTTEIWLAHALPLYGKGKFDEPTSNISRITIDAFENSNGRKSAEVRMFSLTGQRLIKTFDSSLISESSKPTQHLADYLGLWSFSYQSKFAIEHSHAIEFFDNGVASITSNLNPMTIPWGIENHEMVFSPDSGDFKVKLVRNLPFGKLLFLEHSYQNESSIVPALMVKHQGISFNDIDYQKTWTPIETKRAAASFKVDENNNFNYLWKHAELAQNIDGKLVRYTYTLDKKEVDYCNVSLPNCEVALIQQLKLLAIHGDKIAVEYGVIDSFTVDDTMLNTEIMLFELSDDVLEQSNVYQSFSERDRYQYAFDSHADFYAQSDAGVIHLARFTRCTGEQPQRVCQEAVKIDGQDYLISALEDRILLVHIDTNERSYLQFIDSDESGIDICHFREGQVCSNENTRYFTKARPNLDISITIQGQGEVKSSSTNYAYGASFSLEVEPAVGHELDRIEGCNGVLQTDAFSKPVFSVFEPKRDCKINAVFVKSPPYVGDVVYVNPKTDIPHSWRLRFENKSFGEFYSHDASFGTKMTQISEDLFRARFVEGAVQVSANGTSHISAVGFDLHTEEHVTKIVWRAVNKFTREEYDLAPIELVRKNDLSTLTVSTEELVGSWLLTHNALDSSLGRFYGQNFKLKLSPDNQGVMAVISLNPSLANFLSTTEVPISWRINQSGHVQIYNEQYNFSFDLKMIQRRGDGFNLVVDDVIESKTSELRFVWPRVSAGALVQMEDSAYDLNELVGKWRYQSDFGAEGFEIHAGGVFRKGNLNGAAQTSWSENTLLVTAFINQENDLYDPACKAGFEYCSVGFRREFLVLSKQQDKLYVLERQQKFNINTPQSSGLFVEGLRVISLDSRTSMSQVEPHVIWDPNYKHWRGFGTDYLRLYEKTPEGLKQWRLYHSDNQGLKIDAGSYPHFDAKIENGKLTYHEGGAPYVLEIVSSDSSAISFCEYQSGSTCDSGKLRVMQYEIPVYTVQVETTGGGRVEHNLPRSYQLFGQPLSVNISHSSDLSLDSIGGCGVSHLNTMGSTHLRFGNEHMTESCKLKVHFVKTPALLSERLDISEPFLKACVDNHQSSYYMEYASSLVCQKGEIGALTDLSELSKLQRLERLSLSGIDSITDLALEQLNDMTQLTKLDLSGAAIQHLDLSNLTQLESLTLSLKELTEINLPKGGKLKSLNLAVGGPEHLDLTGLSSLVEVNIGYSTVKSIDLGLSTSLETLIATNAPLESIVGISDENRIRRLGLKNTAIESLNFGVFSLLEFLDVSGSKIRNLDLSSLSHLVHLLAMNMPLENLSIDKSSVRTLRLSNTKLANLDLTNMAELIIVYANDSTLESVNLGNNPKLRVLQLKNNNLDQLYIPDSTQVNVVVASGNRLKSLQVDNDNSNIRTLVLSNNQVEQFDIGNFDKLRSLNLSGNPLVEITKPQSHLMTTLALDNTMLKELDLSTYDGLQNLSVDGTALTSIELVGTLTSLKASNTLIKSLNLKPSHGNLSIEFRGNTLEEISGGESVRNVRLFLRDSTVTDAALEQLKSYAGKVFALICEGDELNTCRRINP
ncbi:leucine-rich repeat domain-containing protein [Pseudoalteromonas luteoviolacea]|uniref:PKD/Chitinase domain-containing protein n=1 Tax=Pseudoalteromonas luteoviolacea DSM 6061 TaxID=1365250 RepID=A0A166V402_9GAMM|nr:leucine-rich repeat domain-containing protein [Pseudoalteromonas luteoviolacea]KZN31685.1 hypothetical protein N475_04320 [Pseudoalteromonas luteoviolacea DSM 6061]MBE0389021.1 hypothetical protein [Pseudoalteromonas luteoviolacea DSM 6061]